MRQNQIFGISQQSAVGSGERVVRSGVEIQDVTEGEEEKTSGPHPSDEETPQSKSIKDPLYNWDESKTSGDSDTDELG